MRSDVSLNISLWFSNLRKSTSTVQLLSRKLEGVRKKLGSRSGVAVNHGVDRLSQPLHTGLRFEQVPFLFFFKKKYIYIYRTKKGNGSKIFGSTLHAVGQNLMES